MRSLPQHVRHRPGHDRRAVGAREAAADAPVRQLLTQVRQREAGRREAAADAGTGAQARIKAVEAKLAAAQVEAGEASGARAEGSGYESVVWLACAAALNNERFPPGQCCLHFVPSAPPRAVALVSHPALHWTTLKRYPR